MRRAFNLCVIALALTVASAAAYADSIIGTIYQNVTDANNAGDLTNNTLSTLAQASFVVGPAGIDFDSQTGGYTATGFLNNPTFTNPLNGFSATGTLDNSEVVLTGEMYLNAGNNALTVGHDDGVVLNVAGFGTVLNQPGPTSFANSPFTVDNTGAAGLFSFTLDYAECCGAPGDLLFAVNSAPVGEVPEPNTLALMGSSLTLGLLGWGATKLRA